ncbi:MAG: hypothetical protein WC554_02865 [Clostridia bacterium]
MRRKNEFKLWTLEDVKWKNIKDTKTNEEIIKELTEIVDYLLIKSKTRINMIKTLGEIAENYKKENADLKQQILVKDNTIAGLEKLLSSAAETKYLNRDEIEKIIRNKNPYPDYLERHHCTDGSEEMDWHDRNERLITAICNLAIPEIDKDKIIEDAKSLIEKYNYWTQQYEQNKISLQWAELQQKLLIEAYSQEIIKAIRGE